MRIAFFVDAFPVVSETFILNQITGLMDRGHTVDIFARHRRRGHSVHDDISRYRLLDRTHDLDGSRSRPQRWLTGLRLLLAMRWLTPNGLGLLAKVVRHRGNTPPFNTLGVLKIASQERSEGAYDVIHCQYGTLGRPLLHLKNIGLIHGRLVTSFRGHDVTQHEKIEPNYYTELFREGDLFLPVSLSLESRLLALGAPRDRTFVHHSGIDCARFPFHERVRAPSEALVVLTIARLVEMKGVAYGIEAVATLLRSGVSVVYHIVGDGPLRQQLTDLIQERGASAHIHLHGAKPNEAVIEFLAGAHVLLAPSVTATNGETEGIPNAVKEAMATGLPVVATRHSGIPELVEDGVSGFLVDERNAAALAERLSYLAVHPETWGAMGRAGRAMIEAQFDRHALNDELVRLYAAQSN